MDYTVGDRVKVEFEGTVTDLTTYGIYVTPVLFGQEEYGFPLEYTDSVLTKIKPALPTKVGSVIKDVYGAPFFLSTAGWVSGLSSVLFSPEEISEGVGAVFTIEYEPEGDG